MGSATAIKKHMGIKIRILVGGDWNHGIFSDFPIILRIIPVKIPLNNRDPVHNSLKIWTHSQIQHASATHGGVDPEASVLSNKMG